MFQVSSKIKEPRTKCFSDRINRIYRIFFRGQNKTFNTESTETPIEAFPQRATEETVYPLTDAVKIPAARDESELLSRHAGSTS